jgi:hypothetical protein
MKQMIAAMMVLLAVGGCTVRTPGAQQCGPDGCCPDGQCPAPAINYQRPQPPFSPDTTPVPGPIKEDCP